MEDVLVRTYVGNFPSTKELPPGSFESIRRWQGKGAEDWRCPHCLGSGIVPLGSSDVTCRACGGTGVVHGVRQAMFVDSPDTLRAAEVIKQYLGGKRSKGHDDVTQFLLLAWSNEGHPDGGTAQLWTDPAGIVLGNPDTRPPRKDGGPRGLPLWNARDLPSGMYDIGRRVEGPRAFGVALSRTSPNGPGSVATGTVVYAAVRAGGIPPRILRVAEFTQIAVSKKKATEFPLEYHEGGKEAIELAGREVHTDASVIVQQLINRAIALTFAPSLRGSYLPRR